MRFLLTLALLPGCSLIFSAEDLSGEDARAGADSGVIESVDGGSADTPDAAQGIDAAQAPDAEPEICDPFSEAGCYVGNDPLDGPDFYVEGSGAECSSCEQSNDCAPGLFCSGYVGSPGSCHALCSPVNPCSAGSCLSVQHEDYGFCQEGC